MRVIGESMVIDFRKRKRAELIFFIKFKRHNLVAQGILEEIKEEEKTKVEIFAKKIYNKKYLQE